MIEGEAPPAYPPRPCPQRRSGGASVKQLRARLPLAPHGPGQLSLYYYLATLEPWLRLDIISWTSHAGPTTPTPRPHRPIQRGTAFCVGRRLAGMAVPPPLEELGEEPGMGHWPKAHFRSRLGTRLGSRGQAPPQDCSCRLLAYTYARQRRTGTCVPASATRKRPGQVSVLFMN